MNYKKIALIGMMACGKSTISKYLSKKLDYPNYELDEIFEQLERTSIKDFFEQHGEIEFRKKETQILDRITQKDCFILSTGGGVVLSPKNRELLFKKDILTIYLSIDPKTVLNRIKGDTTRPLLNVSNPYKKIEQKFNERKKYYNLANLKIVVDNKTIEQITEEILAYGN